MNGVEPYAYLRDLFTKLANGHLARDIDALMPWAYTRATPGFRFPQLGRGFCEPAWAPRPPAAFSGNPLKTCTIG